MPIRIVIDNIRSASNIGSVFRTCDAFGIEKIYLCGISATPPNREILKTALGATESVAWEYHPDAMALVQQLKKDPSVYLVAIEQDPHSVPLKNLNVPENTTAVFILGNEVEGVASELLQQVHAIVEIPQFGIKKSLNVAVAAGIVLWQEVQKNLT